MSGDTTVGIATVAPFHHSIGDIAVAEATREGLALRGIPAIDVVLHDENEPTVKSIVIGGGEVMYAGSSPRWQMLLARFRSESGNVLNAAGADLSTFAADDWDFLRRFDYISVRDEPTAKAIHDAIGADVFSVPCPATLIRPFAYELLRELPGYEFFRGVDPGQYDIVHRHPDLRRVIGSRAHRTVTIEMQAWANWEGRWRGRSLPASHSARVVATVVANARSVVSRSLHLGIFALGAVTPFVVIDSADRQGGKMRRYFERAGIPEAVIESTAPRDIQAAINAVRTDILDISRRERRLASEHLDRIANCLAG